MVAADVFKAPLVTMPLAIRIVTPERTTVENWMRAGIITPELDEKGQDRRFSLRNLLQIELLHRLRDVFRVEASAAGYIAAELVLGYEARAGDDLLEVWADFANIGKTDYRPTYELIRDKSGELRAYQRDDRPSDDGVMIIVPVGLIARGLFAKFKILSDHVLDRAAAMDLDEAAKA